MTFDAIESSAFAKGSLNLSEQLSKLHAGFDSKVSAARGVYEDFSVAANENVAKWLGEETALQIEPTSVRDTVKQMYSGVENADGTKTLGLKEISEWKVNPDYAEQNIKQQSGYAAEVISTAKENLIAEAEGTGTKTWRADDRPDLFQKNDQYVDKIREYADGTIEKIQTKFVGNNAKECLSRLTSKDYDKYFEEGRVDKLEVPSDYYDEMKELITEKKASLEQQIDRVKKLGKEDVAQKKQAQLDRLEQVDKMLEKSTVSRKEAIDARINPERYKRKIIMRTVVDGVKTSNREGIKSGAIAAGLTATVSTVDNVQKVMSGEITPEEAATDIAKDTAIAGVAGYGTAFISTAASQAMSASSRTLIKSIGDAGIPAMAITFAVSSYDSVSDYAQGTIDGSELATDLGRNAVNVAGGALGSAAAGAAATAIVGVAVHGAATGAATGAVAGSVVPGAGTAAGGAVGGVIGFAAGLAGGMVGTAIASEAYTTALEYGPEAAQGFADKAQEMADQAVESVQQYAPTKVDSIKTALHTYIKENNLPIKV